MRNFYCFLKDFFLLLLIVLPFKEWPPCHERNPKLLPLENLFKKYCCSFLSANLNGLFHFLLSAMVFKCFLSFPTQHHAQETSVNTEFVVAVGKVTLITVILWGCPFNGIYEMHIEFAYCIKVKEWLFCQDWRHSFWSEIELSTLFLSSNQHHKEFIILNLTYGYLNDGWLLGMI